MTDIVESQTHKANIVLDASKIDLFETCPVRYNYRYNLRRGLPIHHKAKALDMGTLIHEGMEVYFNGLAKEQPFSERIEAGKMRMRMTAADPNISNSEPEDLNIVLKAFEESCDYWRADDENCIEVLAVESPFAYILYEDEYVRVIITGKIDLLCNYHGIGNNASYQNLVIDHKSYSRDGIVLRKTNQFINYCVATESNYLLVNRIGLQKSVKPEDKYKRLPMTYDPDYKQAWKDNLIKMILQEYLPCIADSYWPEKPTSCNKFNRICEYYEVCDSSGQEAKLFKLENNYVEAPEWDVTAKLE